MNRDRELDQLHADLNAWYKAGYTNEYPAVKELWRDIDALEAQK